MTGKKPLFYSTVSNSKLNVCRLKLRKKHVHCPHTYIHAHCTVHSTHIVLNHNGGGGDLWCFSRLENPPSLRPLWANNNRSQNTIQIILFLLLFCCCCCCCTLTRTLWEVARTDPPPAAGKAQSVERLYCKRPIPWLASSKILTPHPPLSARRVCTPAFDAGGGHTGWAERGWGVNILEDARHSSVLYIRKYLVAQSNDLTRGPS